MTNLKLDLSNKEVRHLQLGTGRIIGQTETQVTVAFGGVHGIKKFPYPTAFETFIEMCDPVDQKELEDELGRLQQFHEQVRQMHKVYAKNEKLKEDKAKTKKR
ncbi:MAG: hypothetical protein LBN36_01730 [Clostridiales Family XIII bacterium]|nr:hypothetical protein [Clostridiales Family XIII bacterium]